MELQDLYDRKKVTRETVDSAMVVQTAATPVFTAPTTLQELYDQKRQTRLDTNTALVITEVP